MTGNDTAGKRLKYAFPIIIFVAFTCLFYGPLSTYLPNAEEIWFDIGTLMKVIVPFSLFAVALMSLFFAVLPEKIGAFFRKLLFGVALALYIQGNWIKMSYGSGVLDGGTINWDEYRTYGMVNSIIWIICIAIPFIASLILRKVKTEISIESAIIAASLFLTAIQIPAMISQFLSYLPNTSGDMKASTENMYELGKEDNIIFVILDAMEDQYFMDYLEKNPEYRKELEGFVHFDNTLSSGSRTILAIPSMFTGHPYRRQGTYTEYLDEIWGGDNSLSALSDAGYSVRVYAEMLTHTKAEMEYVDNFQVDKGEVSSYKTLLKKVYKLDLFKFAPHFMKKRFMFNTTEFNSARLSLDSYRTNDPKFYSNFAKSKFLISGEEDKVFVLYHLAGAHTPYNMAADTSKVDESTVEEQVEGCFTGLKMMMDDLKEKGIYDDSTIIVSADHGDMGTGYHPLLLIKEKGAKDEYSESHVPASLFDIPVYLAGLGGKELTGQEFGEKIFELEEGQKRERHFFYNTSGNSRLVVKEYVADESPITEESVVEVNSYEDDGADRPYILGTELSFARDATGNKYTREGFGNNTGFRTFLLGGNSELSVPIDSPPGEGELTVKIGLHNQSNKVGPMEIYAGENLVAEYDVDASVIKAGLEFKVPVSYLEEGRLNLRFHFPKYEDRPTKATVSFTTLVIK